VSPTIRRAQCFSCGGIFPIGDLVQRLLAVPEVIPPALEPPQPEAVTPFEAWDDLPVAPAPFEHSAPTLSPSDLEGVDAEILDKTLIEPPPAALPEAKEDLPLDLGDFSASDAPALPTPAPVEMTASGYTSARDAIDKLFGDAPAPATAMKVNHQPDAMDMEATLSALESTLGGALPAPQPTEVSLPGDAPTDSGLPESEETLSSTATVRLSQKELLAALTKGPAAPTADPRPLEAPRATEGRTESLPSAPLRPFLPTAGAGDTGAELLRLKVDEEIYGNLTMPQLIAWVEEGRILENHLVARQHSENWLEAHKVPGLRPVFERLRRDRTTALPTMDSGNLDIAPKKSLFGGLFGKK
jgi:hypothetical protein